MQLPTADEFQSLLHSHFYPGATKIEIDVEPSEDLMWALVISGETWLDVHVVAVDDTAVYCRVEDLTAIRYLPNIMLTR